MRSGESGSDELVDDQRRVCDEDEGAGRSTPQDMCEKVE